MTQLGIYIILSIIFTGLNYIILRIVVKSALEKALETDESEKVERYRKLSESKQKELEFYQSRCFGAEKKISLLEEEITKSRTKK